MEDLTTLERAILSLVNNRMLVTFSAGEDDRLSVTATVTYTRDSEACGTAPTPLGALLLALVKVARVHLAFKAEDEAGK